MTFNKSFNMKTLTYSIFFLLIICCNNKQDDIIESANTGQIFGDMFDNKEARDSIANRAIYSNDTLAYKELRKIYYLSDNANEFYYYALLMYNRNKYIPSTEDLYFILNKIRIDSTTDKLSKEYLKKSKE